MKRLFYLKLVEFSDGIFISQKNWLSLELVCVPKKQRKVSHVKQKVNIKIFKDNRVEW